MKPKTLTTFYWALTILCSLSMLMAGVVEMMRSAEGQEIMRHLGYPVYILTIIGVGKTLGALALIQNAFRTLKEWAYAGFTINMLGAAASRAYAGDSLALILSPFLFLAVLLTSYFLWKKRLAQLSSQRQPSALKLASEPTEKTLTPTAGLVA
ncbi:DoxX family protein [Hymenobacter crusticola]|uniref:DoxX-like family protein n=1 Tax=Hymenobacter crusticola TaxID=1770526 RepID=A0A243WJ43_9BACT|nr:DoxX family protein [Hymenobacter crusticola]OUJ75084.1 hypothetical protein BXP70_03390 [Hymenobacter crusticola]